MIRALPLDIDGTIRKHSAAIPGAVDFINGNHLSYTFLSNTADRTGAKVAQELRDILDVDYLTTKKIDNWMRRFIA